MDPAAPHGDQDQEYQREFYDRHYARRAAAVRDQHVHPLFRSFNDRSAARVLDSIPQPAGRSLAVFEIGCGEGLLGSAVERLAIERNREVTYTGSDLSAAALDIAREVVTGQLLVGDASAVAAQLSPASQDVVVAKNLLHHLDDPAGFLRTVRPMLAPGGRVVAFEPRLGCPQFLLFNVLAARRERHYFEGQRRNRAAFAAAGYRVVSCDRFSWLPYELAFVIRPDYFRRMFSTSNPAIIAKVSAADDRLTKSITALACYAVWIAEPQ
ncbi:MAG: class I SAM-dependent methyltransferase [Pseudonocardiaceae bacterium]